MKFPFVIIRRSVWAGILAQMETLRTQSIKMMGTVEKLTESNIELYTKCRQLEAEAEKYKRESRAIEQQYRLLRKGVNRAGTGTM